MWTLTICPINVFLRWVAQNFQVGGRKEKQSNTTIKPLELGERQHNKPKKFQKEKGKMTSATFEKNSFKNFELWNFLLPNSYEPCFLNDFWLTFLVIFGPLCKAEESTKLSSTFALLLTQGRALKLQATRGQPRGLQVTFFQFCTILPLRGAHLPWSLEEIIGVALIVSSTQCIVPVSLSVRGLRREKIIVQTKNKHEKWAFVHSSHFEEIHWIFLHLGKN